MIDDNFLIDKYYIKDNRCGHRIYGKRLLHITEEEIQYLTNRFTDSDSIHEALQRIFFKIEEKKKCPICGKPVLWLGKRNRLMLQTCSLECGFKLRQKHNEEYWLNKENVSNVFATKECVEKIKNTKFERYGDENYNNNEQTVKTCLEKYGTKNGGYTKESAEKIKQTSLMHFGVDCPLKSEEVKNQIKQTCLNKYGKTSYLQSNEYKKHQSEYLIKRINTLKKHNKLTNSKAEAFIYNLFTHYFKEIICQYYSDNYPFYCDFYIPEINTYIEYQGYYTHGGHPFDSKNIDDINELNKLINLNINHKTPYKNLYNSKIKTWTNVDVLKRNIAKQHNLNYIEFWNYKEVINWLDNNYEKKY